MMCCAFASPAVAGIRPYVRFDYGGRELRMTDVDQMITDNQAAITAIGYPASFAKIGSAYGPSGSAGLWLFPNFRVGGTVSRLRALRSNRVHVPGSYFFQQDLDFSMVEVGGEAVLRFPRLAGLMLGGGVAQGTAKAVEGLSEATPSFEFYQDATAERRLTTYDAFVGLDQTNAAGVAGFVRAGFAFRDVGHMPSRVTQSDGVTSVTFDSSSRWSDYSGFYLKVGVGYDLGH
jgi:hypothetical protein